MPFDIDVRHLLLSGVDKFSSLLKFETLVLLHGNGVDRLTGSDVYDIVMWTGLCCTYYELVVLIQRRWNMFLYVSCIDHVVVVDQKQIA